MTLAGLGEVANATIYDADTLLAATASAEGQLKARTRALVWAEMQKKGTVDRRTTSEKYGDQII